MFSVSSFLYLGFSVAGTAGIPLAMGQLRRKRSGARRGGERATADNSADGGEAAFGRQFGKGAKYAVGKKVTLVARVLGKGVALRAMRREALLSEAHGS